MTSSSLQLQFKKYVSNFFVTLQSMTVPNFMSKELSFQDLRRGALFTPLRGMIRQKYPGADRV